jgi:hypothetical protein
MPFKSKAQQRMMFAKHPRLAKEWAAETPNIASLPEKVTPMSKKAADDGRFFEKRALPQKGRFFRDMVGRDDGMFLDKAAQTPSSTQGGANATNSAATAAKADQSSKLNIGATGAPMGGSGFRGQGMGGGMYGTGDGDDEYEETEKEAAATKAKQGLFDKEISQADVKKHNLDSNAPIPSRHDKGPDGKPLNPNRPMLDMTAKDSTTGKPINPGPVATAKPKNPYPVKKRDPWDPSLAERERSWAKARKEPSTPTSRLIGNLAGIATGKITTDQLRQHLQKQQPRVVGRKAAVAQQGEGAVKGEEAIATALRPRVVGKPSPTGGRAGFVMNPREVGSQETAQREYKPRREPTSVMAGKLKAPTQAVKKQEAGANRPPAYQRLRAPESVMSGRLRAPERDEGESQFAIGKNLEKPVHIRTGPMVNLLPQSYGTGSGMGKRATVLDLLKVGAASPTDWDADASLATGFHRPANEQPEPLEAGGERFHSTEGGTVASSRNNRRHGLVEGGSMSMRSTASPQMGKHASVSRFLGTSFGIEKSAEGVKTPSEAAARKIEYIPSYYKQPSESGGGWLGNRAGEFKKSLGRATEGGGDFATKAVKSITQSAPASVLASLIALRLGVGGVRGIGRLGKRIVRGKPPVPEAGGGIINKIVSGAKNLVASGRNYVTK